jgi:hypothetical protein
MGHLMERKINEVISLLRKIVEQSENSPIAKQLAEIRQDVARY